MTAGSQVAEALESRFADLLGRARRRGPVKAAIVAPHKQHVLTSVCVARDMGLISPLLVGDGEKIREAGADLPLDGAPVVQVSAPAHAVDVGAALVGEHEAELLVKGAVHTDAFMRAALRVSRSLDPKSRLSHVYACFVPSPVYHKPVFITDGALNIAPDVDTKWQIITNAVGFLGHLGIPRPKIAILAAAETVRTDMSATMDAAVLCKMSAQTPGFDAITDGPLALDVALSAVSAQIKDLSSDVAGEPDLLVVPTIEVGNVLVKTLARFPKAIASGVVVGGRYPIVLPSRSDSVESRVMAYALAAAAMPDPTHDE